MPKKASCRSPKKKTLSKKTMKKKSPKKCQKKSKKSKKSRRPKTELLTYHPGQYYLPNKYTENGFAGCREIGGIPRHSFTTSRGTKVGATCVAPKGQRVLSEPSPCYGKLKKNCSADDGCHWTKRYQTRFGTVAGHCGLIPGKRSPVGSVSSVTSDVSPASSYTTVSGSSTPSSSVSARLGLPQMAGPMWRPAAGFVPRESMTEEQQLIEDVGAGLPGAEEALAAYKRKQAEQNVFGFRFHGGHRRMY